MSLTLFLGMHLIITIIKHVASLTSNDFSNFLRVVRTESKKNCSTEAVNRRRIDSTMSKEKQNQKKTFNNRQNNYTKAKCLATRIHKKSGTHILLKGRQFLLH